MGGICGKRAWVLTDNLALNSHGDERIPVVLIGVTDEDKKRLSLGVTVSSWGTLRCVMGRSEATSHGPEKPMVSLWHWCDQRQWNDIATEEYPICG
jgi:hypothetical protein